MKPFVCENCIECCANVMVSEKEMIVLRRAARKMPAEEIDRLRSQDREEGTCPFADVENKRCTVYDVRPWVCRKFGFVEKMQCSYNTHVPLADFGASSMEYFKQIGLEEMRDGKPAILGVTHTWERGIINKKEG